MIKARLRLPAGRTAILLGVTDRNIERMRAGDPMRVTLGEIVPDLRDYEVVIVTGADEGEISRNLIAVGLLDEAAAAQVKPGMPMQPGEERIWRGE